MTHALLLSAGLGLALAAPAAQTPAPAPPADAAAGPRVVLLGEVHDNADGHRLRLEHLRAEAGDGARVAIAMEQFDRERQAELDAAMARCADADCVIDAAAPGRKGWDWAHYAPVVQFALDHHVPLLAANLSRAEASAVVKGGFEAALSPELRTRYALDALPAALLEAQMAEVRDGHCGMLPEAMLAPMARAQIARDVVMAETLRTALAATDADAPERVFLLAGNGHVDREVGVPQWLATHGPAGAQVVAVGYLEAGADEARSHYDAVYLVPPAEREDPCAGFSTPAPRAAP